MILMSQTEFATLVGEKPNEIAKLISRGKITAVEGKPKKLIMPQAKKQYHLAKGGGGGHEYSSQQPEEQTTIILNDDIVADPVTELAVARVLKERYLGKLHKQRFSKESKELLPLDEVNRQTMEVCSIIRNGLINLPNKISNQLAGLSSGDIQIRLTTEINEILANLHSLGEQYEDE